MKIDCDITASANHHISGAKSVGTKVLHADHSAHFGNNSVIIMGNDTSVIKSSILSSANVSTMTGFVGQGVFDSSDTPFAGLNTDDYTLVGLTGGYQLIPANVVDGEFVPMPQSQVDELMGTILDNPQVTSLFNVVVNGLNGGVGATVNITAMAGNGNQFEFYVHGADGTAQGANYPYLFDALVAIYPDAFYPGSPQIIFMPVNVANGGITVVENADLDIAWLGSNYEPTGTTRIVLKAKEYSLFVPIVGS